MREAGARYDLYDEINLSQLEPLIALPSSPANVRPVSEVAGKQIYQSYIGSSANPGYRDFAVAAAMVCDRRVDSRVSFDINPTSRAQLETLVRDGHIGNLLHAGARLHQAGCNGCIGMGQAPAMHALSLRTVPRNFPGRSGTHEDKVCLVSPETAAASALSGAICDPRSLAMPYPTIVEPSDPIINRGLFERPLPSDVALRVELQKGTNIVSLPMLESLPDSIEAPVLLKVGDNISTDEILPAGARVLPFRSNIPKIAEFCFSEIDATYAQRARQTGTHFIVAGRNYGQGSSREHAAFGPRFLGLRAVLAKDFARIHAQNLVNFGVLPLTFVHPEDYDKVQSFDKLRLGNLGQALATDNELLLDNMTQKLKIKLRHRMSPRQVQLVLKGGLINWTRQRLPGRLENPSGCSSRPHSGRE